MDGARALSMMDNGSSLSFPSSLFVFFFCSLFFLLLFRPVFALLFYFCFYFFFLLFYRSFFFSLTIYNMDGLMDE